MNVLFEFAPHLLIAILAVIGGVLGTSNSPEVLFDRYGLSSVFTEKCFFAVNDEGTGRGYSRQEFIDKLKLKDGKFRNEVTEEMRRARSKFALLKHRLKLIGKPGVAIDNFIPGFSEKIDRISDRLIVETKQVLTENNLRTDNPQVSTRRRRR